MNNTGNTIPERDLYKIEGGLMIYPLIEISILCTKLEKALNKFIESLMPEIK
jgi:hypothetical protein